MLLLSYRLPKPPHAHRCPSNPCRVRFTTGQQITMSFEQKQTLKDVIHFFCYRRVEISSSVSSYLCSMKDNLGAHTVFYSLSFVELLLFISPPFFHFLIPIVTYLSSQWKANLIWPLSHAVHHMMPLLGFSIDLQYLFKHQRLGHFSQAT